MKDSFSSDYLGVWLFSLKITCNTTASWRGMGKPSVRNAKAKKISLISLKLKLGSLFLNSQTRFWSNLVKVLMYELPYFLSQKWDSRLQVTCRLLIHDQGYLLSSSVSFFQGKNSDSISICAVVCQKTDPLQPNLKGLFQSLLCFTQVKCPPREMAMQSKNGKLKIWRIQRLHQPTIPKIMCGITALHWDGWFAVPCRGSLAGTPPEEVTAQGVCRLMC